MEIVITSESSGQLWNSCVWEPVTGTSLRSYKGGISCSKSLNIIGEDYVISSQKDKPMLQVWALNRQDQQHSKMIMPGIIQVLTVSPCRNFCVGGASEQIMIWQIATGKMVASLRRHYQNVSCIKFTSDSSYFVSTGTEGLVLVWSMETVLSSSDNESEPLFTWSDHSLPVTGLYITNSIIQPLVFTVSLDQTCKIHDLHSGKTLMSIQFYEALHSVIVDNAEQNCYIGTSSGRIHEIGLLDPPRNIEKVVEDAPGLPKFSGHVKLVSCLSISIDGSHLLSGSDDCTARTWDILSGQCIRILTHQGPLTNAFYVAKFKHFEMDKFQPSVIFNTFEKKREPSVNAEVLISQLPFNEPARGQVASQTSKVVSDELLHNKVDNLTQVNKRIFDFAVTNILAKGKKK